MAVKWETISRSDGGNFKIFNLAWYKRRHPEWKRENDFVVLDTPSWVNIIPITSDNKVILIEQYRHGTDSITLEVPGGIVENGEDPRLAAERECREETGYLGKGDSELLGVNEPNPAFLTNKCFSYLWTGCSLQTVQELDRHEDIKVIEVPMTNIKSMILSGKITHSLVLDAFFFYSLKYSL
jgi:8-oxo-dGTP pyrophosphatase MutT (NUDIX family)